MSKICLLTDTHFGWKNDSVPFHRYFDKFYKGTFFPELERRQIKTVVHGGDLFERRKYVNFDILYRTRHDFLERLLAGKYETHIIVGNHDCYHTESNHVNAVTELVSRRYSNFHIYEEPAEVAFNGLKVLLVPWLNASNMKAGLNAIGRSAAPVLIGHLEINGMPMDNAYQISKKGLEAATFNKFKKVLSGHFHHPSVNGKIQYLGSPYEMTFADTDDARGFYIFDTESLELEFIQNPNQMFFKLIYDDRDEKTHGPLLTADYSKFAGKMVKVKVLHKTNPYLYDQYMDRLDKVNPLEVQPEDNYVAGATNVSEAIQEEIKTVMEGNLDADTKAIMEKHVDAMEMSIDLDRLKGLLEDLYCLAKKTMGNVDE